MNWKLVLLGGLTFWLVTNIAGMFVTGPVIHNKILEPAYRAHESFWIPELNEDPPDMAAVMPHWLLTSLIGSLVVAALYGVLGSSLSGAGWKRGMTFGFCLALLLATTYLGMSGVLALPATIWIWWSLDGLVLYLVAGAAMGWVGERFAAG